MPPAPDVTGLLLAWSRGDAAAAAPLMDAVYDELRRLARGFVRRERRQHALQGTALVHDVYLKLVDQRRVQWQNRTHFFAVAAHAMRRALVDEARAHGAAKRGAAVTVALDSVDDPCGEAPSDILALHLALEKLEAIDPRQARLVELRYFGGLTVDEAAEVLAVAPVTVKRDWVLARTWLFRELGGSA
jgi:RNA polymerase sigma-70 factor (ECF subfamily)